MFKPYRTFQSVLLVALTTSLFYWAGCSRHRPMDTVATGSITASGVDQPTGARASRKTAPTMLEADVIRARKGRIVEGPSNIRGFRPAESLTKVDAGNIDLRQVFEDLGEDTTLWYQHVQTLSNPFFEGRSGGTRGFELATEYVAFYMKLYDLKGAFPIEAEELGGAVESSMLSYEQPFSYGGRQRRTFDLQGKYMAINNQELAYGEDFVVLAPSGGERVTLPITFVGYGIEAGEDGYSSFDDETDLTGRAALLLRYEPLNVEGASQWAKQRFSRHARIATKIESLVKRGAAAIILVNPPAATQGNETLESLTSSARFSDTLDAPLVQITPEVADHLLTESDPQGRDLATLGALADSGEITSIELSDEVTVTVGGQANMEVHRDQTPSSNVAGILPGKGELADEWIVIGGHYDHMGYGRSGTVYPGADDNASGTAGTLILAKRFSQIYAEAEDDANLRSILFMAFGAEEAGLRGSAHFVEHPTIPLEAISLMVNMDMIGRLRSDQLMIGGAGSAEEFDDLLARHVAASGLTVYASSSGRGPSDHANFYGKDIPVLFLFSGLHDEYHQPGDHGYTVNPIGAMDVIDLAESIVMEVASRDERLTFAAASEQTPGGGNRRRARGPSRSGASVQFGIVPNYRDQRETGVLVADLTAGSPAYLAGIKPGDILVEWDGEELTGLRRMMQLLREQKPDDRVVVTVLRDGEYLKIEVVLIGIEAGAT